MYDVTEIWIIFDIVWIKGAKKVLSNRGNEVDSDIVVCGGCSQVSNNCRRYSGRLTTIMSMIMKNTEFEKKKRVCIELRYWHIIQHISLSSYCFVYHLGHILRKLTLCIYLNQIYSFARWGNIAWINFTITRDVSQ